MVVGMTVDLDLECPGGGPGEGVALAFPNGVFLKRGPDWACDAMATVVLEWYRRRGSF